MIQDTVAGAGLAGLWASISAALAPNLPSADGGAQQPTLEVDAYGAPVTFEPARWLVCFVPGLRPQFWHPFVHKTHKHVLMLKPNSDGTWTLFEPWWTRILIRTIRNDQAMRYLRWAALGDALFVEEEVPGRGSQFRGWSNCASLAVFVLGRPYCVWSPHALFTRLRAEHGAKHVDVGALVNRYLTATPERAAAVIEEHWG